VLEIVKQAEPDVLLLDARHGWPLRVANPEELR
jgi:hypothetical protein